MEHCAWRFDQPIDSPEHQDLADTAWMGGELVSVRYWLGRLVGRNLFRESNESVKEALRRYLVDRGCEKGASVVDDYQAWKPLAILLQHRVEILTRTKLTKKAKLVAAIEALLVDPELTDSQLAATAKTTEKQIARLSDVTVMRKAWRVQQTEKSSPYRKTPA